MKVVKRNGKVVEYEREKISAAISKATTASESTLCDEDLSVIITFVEEQINEREEQKITVEEIQDTIEILLMKYNPVVARHYILYREDRNKERSKPWDMNELQEKIFNSKYRFRSESFPEYLERISNGDSSIAKLTRNQKFSFAGRILAGRNTSRNVTLSNCYVSPAPEDNIESIFDVAKWMARTYSYGGGVGVDLSKLRPNGFPVKNASKTTTGPVSFMDIYNVTTGVIGQNNRRGALMISMSSNHPDIHEFLTVKNNPLKLTNANISVRADGDLFTVDSEENRKILNEIAKSNWESGEPGLLYWELIEDWHLLSEHPLYVLVGVNPCGEQPLIAFGNCLLGSINLSKYVIKPFTDEASFDYNSFVKDVETAVIGLNDVLEQGIHLHPLQEQRDAASNFRQIGLGIMGLADMFVKMGIKYGDDESIKISHQLGTLMRDISILTSVDLAKEKGPYPMYNFEYIEKSKYFKSLSDSIQEAIQKHGMRNSHLLSIAPTGSISTMYGVSGGIEPIFANSFIRTTKSLGNGSTDFKVYTEVIKELMEAKGITDENDLPDYCVTTHDIDPFDRIKVQAAWQHYVDSAISSTINLKEETTVETIEEIYREGYRAGLKGLTVYRDNCARTGILNKEAKESKESKESKEEKPIQKKEDICPSCGGKINRVEGCMSCIDCGWSACSI